MFSFDFPTIPSVVYYNGYNLSNVDVIDNLDRLRYGLTVNGYEPDVVQVYVTGGDSYIDHNGVVRSTTTGQVVPHRETDSAHNIENGARAVDLRETPWIHDDDYRNIVDQYTDFYVDDDEPRNEYQDNHWHLRLQR